MACVRRESKHHSRVVRGKGVPAVKENILVVRLIGAKASSAVPNAELQGQDIQHGFGCQHAGLSHALVVGDVSPEVAHARQSGGGCQSRVGKEVKGMIVRVLHRERAVRIGRKQARCNSGGWHQPLEITGVLCGTGW